MTKRQRQSKKAIEFILEVTGLTQARFAELIGASLDGVKGWTRKKNPSPVSTDFRNRIFWEFGADIKPDGSVIQLANKDEDGKPFTKESLAYWRKQRMIASEKGAMEMTAKCADTIRRMFLAAIPVVETQRSKLPAVVASFNEWTQKATDDFKLRKRFREIYDKENKPPRR